MLAILKKNALRVIWKLMKQYVL